MATARKVPRDEGHVDKGLAQGLLEIFSPGKEDASEAKFFMEKKGLEKGARLPIEDRFIKKPDANLSGAVEDDDIKERHQKGPHEDLDEGHVRRPHEGVYEGGDETKKPPGHDGIEKRALPDDKKSRQREEKGHQEEEEVIDLHRSVLPPETPQPTR